MITISPPRTFRWVRSIPRDQWEQLEGERHGDALVYMRDSETVLCQPLYIYCEHPFIPTRRLVSVSWDAIVQGIPDPPESPTNGWFQEWTQIEVHGS